MAVRNTIQAELSRLLILTRHFFRRLFLNETVFFEEQMMMKVIGFIAILSVFPAYVAEALLFKYLFRPDKGTSWVEISLFMSLIMLLIGMIILLEWDAIYLDRRDFLNLMPLPLRPLVIFSAKFISLVLFVGMFVAGINSISSCIFWMYLAESRSFSLLSSLRLFAVHMLTMFAAGGLMFFVMAIIAGFLNIFLRGKIFQRFSDLIRFGLLAGHIFLLYVFLIDYRLIQLPFERLQALKESPTGLMMYFPPLWFSGLYQVLLGEKDAFFKILASRALLALAVAIAIFFIITLSSYSRHLKKSSPEAARHLRPSLMRRAVEPVLNLTLIRDPVERAAFWFYFRGMTQSRTHRTKLLSYLAGGVGVTLILLVSSGKLAWLAQSGFVLSIPLALSFFLLVGIRDASNISVTFEANWVFRLTEGPDRWRYFAGLRKSILLFAILPLHVLLFLLYCLVWDWTTAGLHCLYGLAFAVLLTEGLFFQHQKLPFACSYLPGKSRMHVFWLVYLFGFLAYIFIPPWMEPYFLASNLRFIVFYALVLLIVFASWLYHRLVFYPKHGLIYEDNPEPSLDELFSFSS